MKRRCVIEEAVGETRAAVYEGRKLVELYLRRWSQAGKPHAGDRFAGRITDIDKNMAAAFVDMGFGEAGFLKFTNASGAPRLTEGQMIEVDVTRAAETGKGPVLKFIDMSVEDSVGRISGKDLRGFISKRFGGAVKFDEAAVNAIEEATDRELAVPGGGDIAVDFTRALVAIDIDKGAANSGYTVGQAASTLIADQLRLRGIGGLIVIDFPNLRQPKQRNQLYKTMQAAFANDPNTVKIAPMSRFGTVELTRSKTGRSLDEKLNDRYGHPTIETQAIRALRALEKEGRASPGAKLELTVPEDVYAWLVADIIVWRETMTDRLGARFELKAGDNLQVRPDR